MIEEESRGRANAGPFLQFILKTTVFLGGNVGIFVVIVNHNTTEPMNPATESKEEGK